MAYEVLPPYVEGNSGVGKSVPTVALAARCASGQSVPEHVDYLEPERGESLAFFPPSMFEEVVNSNGLWPMLDMRRQEHRQRLRGAPACGAGKPRALRCLGGRHPVPRYLGQRVRAISQ
jgi:hypothetical protein